MNRHLLFPSITTIACATARAAGPAPRIGSPAAPAAR